MIALASLRARTPAGTGAGLGPSHETATPPIRRAVPLSLAVGGGARSPGAMIGVRTHPGRPARPTAADKRPGWVAATTRAAAIKRTIPLRLTGGWGTGSPRAMLCGGTRPGCPAWHVAAHVRPARITTATARARIPPGPAGVALPLLTSRTTIAGPGSRRAGRVGLDADGPEIAKTTALLLTGAAAAGRA